MWLCHPDWVPLAGMRLSSGVYWAIQDMTRLGLDQIRKGVEHGDGYPENVLRSPGPTLSRSGSQIVHRLVLPVNMVRLSGFLGRFNNRLRDIAARSNRKSPGTLLTKTSYVDSQYKNSLKFRASVFQNQQSLSPQYSP
jgi:hypothetical protein